MEMNTANFTNGGGMPSGAKLHGQIQLPTKNESNQLLINHVAQALQSQGTFSGWRAEFPIKDRAFKVYQMITSLRLIQPKIDMQNAAQAALSFEQKAFRDAREKSDYEKECTEKLIHIRDTRARQAAAIQRGMVPPSGMQAGMGAVAQNQTQAAFSQQISRPVQTSSVPSQPQMPVGISDSHQQVTLRQQRQQQQSQAIFQQQRAQQRSGGGVTLTDDLNTLSVQENDHVCRLARQMLAKTSPEHMEKIKMNLQNMNPEQRQYLARRNMDPITYFFRSQALTHMRRHKKNRIEMARAQNAQNTGLDHNTTAAMGDGIMNLHQRQASQNMMNLQRNPTFTMNGQPGLDPSSFIGSVENIQGQQVDGLRSQEAGQLVVPANSSQMNQQQFTVPHNVYQMGQLGQSGQTNVNGAGISPQFLSQHLSTQGVPQDRMQQTSQFQQQQAQTHAHVRAQAAQKAQMTISAQAGQTAPQIQQSFSQQGPSMATLTRPIAPGQMSPVQAPSQARPPSGSAGMGQHATGVQQISGQQLIQGRPQISPALPPAVQEQLAQMSPEQLSQVSPEQLNVFFVNQQRRAMTNSQAATRPGIHQQPMPILQNLSQSGQIQQVAGGQIANNQVMRGSIGLQQPIAGSGGAQPQNPMIQGQQSTPQRRQDHQRQHDLYKLQLLHQQSGGIDMTPDQAKDMDRLNFPPSILSNISHLNNPAVKNIKTWGQLKQFANSNPHVLGGMDIQRLVTLQKLHLAQLLAHGKDIRGIDQGGQGHVMPTPSAQGQQQVSLNQQHLQPGQQQSPVGIPNMRPITVNEIQIARQRLGVQGQSLTDVQIRDLLNRQRQKQLMQAAQNRSAHAFAIQSMSQNQSVSQPQQPPVSVPQSTSPVKQQAKLQPQSAQQGLQGLQDQVVKGQAPGKAVKAPAKQLPKRKTNGDETGESGNVSVQVAAQATGTQSAPSSGPPRQNIPFNREQVTAMLPQQRVQMETYIRKQQGQPRAPISKASADQAWNSLPDKIKQLYNDIAKNVPTSEPVHVSAEQNAGMVQQLRECTDMLGRMDTLVQWFAKIPGQEKNVRSLLAMRVQLMRQFRPGPDWTINDQITITPEHLTGTINYIKKLFHAMITRVNQQQSQPLAQRPSATQPIQSTGQGSMLALNASNLQQLQQQEDALQRARRGSGASVVGATAVPQPPFGAPSPQGVPHAYGPGSFPPEKLKLPLPKKRKQSHPDAMAPGQTSTRVVAGPQPQAAKQPLPPTRLGGAQLTGPFKCSVHGCLHSHNGFTSLPALEEHMEESHKVEEPIDDPLEFALESIRGSLVTDNAKIEAHESKKGSEAGPETSQLPTGTMSPTKSQAKTGGTPATGATPMARVSSQAGPKPESPTPNPNLALRVPGKTPAPQITNSTTSSGAEKESTKPAGQSSEDVMAKNLWAESTISLDIIHDTFMEFGDENLCGLGSYSMEELQNMDAFTKMQSKDTPDSTETGPATQTPRGSDSSKDEDIVKIGSASEDSWVPIDWSSLPSRFEDRLLMNDAWDDMDWETVERKDIDASIDGNGMPVHWIQGHGS